MNSKYTKFLLTAALLPAVSAFGGVFVLTDDACPTAKGDTEIHLEYDGSWTTHYGKTLASDIGVEVAYGLTESLEVDFSLDFGWDYNSNHASHVNFNGLSLGFKNQVLDPESNDAPFGVALVGGFSWAWANTDHSAARDFAFELGVNFQKNLMDGDLILAFTPNVQFGTAYDYEWDGYDDSIVYELAGGASYAIGGGFRIGVEAVYDFVYTDRYDDNAFYLGPNVCFETDSWWVTACVAPRWFSRDSDTNDHDLNIRIEIGCTF